VKHARILLSLVLAVVWLGSGAGGTALPSAAGEPVEPGMSPSQVPAGLMSLEWQRIQGQVAKLTAADGAAEDYFGTSVSVSGDTAVAGAPWANVGSNIYQGAAYVYDTISAVHWVYLPLVVRNRR
jgi:hypothetical protein